MKADYDKRTTVRQLQPGDLALILLPTCGNKLLATWSGPHKVLRECHNGNYELLVGKRKAIYHINSLRKYYVDDADQRDGQCLMIVNESMQKTSQFKTQCKGDITHAFETAKITVFYPTLCKTPDAPLQNELLC